MSRTITLALTAAAVLVPLTMSGCLVSSSREQQIRGAYVQPGTISKVRVNHTTQTEVEEMMGTPSVTGLNDDGTETWTWNWSKHTDEGGTVFLIFAGGSEKTVHESVHVKFEDGVVIKKWRD
jgi:outer membrane protein assembly factor BamE (lipoprotein component of BamABCDE complex)